MIAEIDIWRAAYLMLSWYGDTAATESGRRADEIAANGDDAGAAAWRLVIAAIGHLASVTPSGSGH